MGAETHISDAGKFSGKAGVSDLSAQGQLNEILALASHPKISTAGAMATEQPRDEHVALKEGATEFVSSLSAGVVGTVVLSVATAYATHNYAKALTVPLALGAGAVTKYGLKGAGEHLLLDEKDRTLSAKDLLWGGVDALAGIGASVAEGRAASKIFTDIGKGVLGANVAESTAFDAGKMMAKESLRWGFQTNMSRGLVGGATGAGIWSAPHRLADNWQEISKDPLTGLTNTGLEVGSDILKGGAFGGVLGLGGTLVGRHQEVIGKTRAMLNPEKNVYRLDTYHINDFHSNTEQLPRLKTLLDARMQNSAAMNVDSRFVVPGDIESGRVNFAFTRGGEIENRALMKMGAKEIVPGNHPYDAPGGKFDVPRYPAMMEPVLAEHPDVSLISANLDVSAYPNYARILKPYAVREINTSWGQTKLGTIGLTTEEGALGHIGYRDPLTTAVAAIEKMKAEGVTIFQIHSHLGLGEDIKLAQGLIDNNVRVSAIIGAHSHDALPRPYWVGSAKSSGTLTGQLPFLAYKNPAGFEIPIVQAGHSGNWLGELNQAIAPEGHSVRYQTSSKLHQVSADLPEDPGIRKFLDENLGAINALKSETYDSRAVKPYSVANSRNRETPIANLYTDALYSGLKTRLGDEAPDVVLVHSGGIRSGIPANVELSRLDLANIVMNAGNIEGEKTELALMNLTGAQLKNAIEYGVRERIAEPRPGLMDQVKSLFMHQREVLVDEPGNFVQVSDRLKYSYDASKPALTPDGGGQRIVDLQIKNAAGKFEPVDPTKTYKVAARFHPLDKWTKFKMFGDKTIDEVHQELGVKPLKFSQVDLIAEHIKGKTLDPTVDGAVSGRITDLTPRANGPTLRPGKSLFVAPLFSTFEAMDQKQQ
ncbi:MAG: bifunctional metallophosphatase/5'-nucleotidase [Cyanobacteria bacterium SZAS LIN-3]|nr:bifunctional metallophosphatase/5'-nucleotidase [Cyanobacteria bacterium SZAS LIN-3]